MLHHALERLAGHHSQEGGLLTKNSSYQYVYLPMLQNYLMTSLVYFSVLHYTATVMHVAEGLL